MKLFLDTVPLELFLHVARYLRTQDLLALGLCSRSVHERFDKSRDLWMHLLHTPKKDDVRFLLPISILRPYLYQHTTEISSSNIGENDHGTCILSKTLYQDLFRLDTIDVTPPISPLCSPHLLPSLPLLPICASSTDHALQPIEATLSVDSRTFWSSKGSADPMHSDEWLLYAVDKQSDSSTLGVLFSGVEITPYCAYFQRNHPCFAPLEISVKVGIACPSRYHGASNVHPEILHSDPDADISSRCHKVGGTILWNHTSKRWRISNIDEPQVFSVAPMLMYGTHILIQLHGKRGVQTTDNLFYTVLRHVRVFGVHATSLPYMNLNTLYQCISLYHEETRQNSQQPKTIHLDTCSAHDFSNQSAQKAVIYDNELPYEESTIHISSGNDNSGESTDEISTPHDHSVRLYTFRLEALRKIAEVASMSFEDSKANSDPPPTLYINSNADFTASKLNEEEIQALHSDPAMIYDMYCRWPSLLSYYIQYRMGCVGSVSEWEIYYFARLLEDNFLASYNTNNSSLDDIVALSARLRDLNIGLKRLVTHIFESEMRGAHVIPPQTTRSPLFVYVFSRPQGVMMPQDTITWLANLREHSMTGYDSQYYDVMLDMTLMTPNLGHAYELSICAKRYNLTTRLGVEQWHMSVFEVARDVAHWHDESYDTIEPDRVAPLFHSTLYGDGVVVRPAFKIRSRGRQVALFAASLLEMNSTAIDPYMLPTPEIPFAKETSSLYPDRGILSERFPSIQSVATSAGEPIVERVCIACHVTYRDVENYLRSIPTSLHAQVGGPMPVPRELLDDVLSESLVNPQLLIGTLKFRAGGI